MKGKIISFEQAKRKAMDAEAYKVGNQLREQIMTIYHVGGMEALVDMVREALNNIEKTGKNKVVATWVLMSDVRGWLGDEIADQLTSELQDIIGKGHVPSSMSFVKEDIDQAEAVYHAAVRGTIRFECCPPSEKLFALNHIAVYAAAMDPEVLAVQKQTVTGIEKGKIVVRDGAVLGKARNAIAILMRYSDEVRIRAGFSNTGIPAIIYEYCTSVSNKN